MTTIRLVQIIIGIGVSLRAYELIAARRSFERGGVYEWTILSRTGTWKQDRTVVAIAKWLFGGRGTAILFYLMLLTGVCLTLVSGALAAAIVLTVAISIRSLIRVRTSRLGFDGSDNMSMIVLISVWIARLHSSNCTACAALGFIASQGVIAYVASGYYKLRSSEWRSGVAIASIMRSRNYGSPYLSEILMDRPYIAWICSWTVICFELVGPFISLVNPSLCWGFIAFGTTFHLAAWLSMRLGSFFWSFTSIYPALFFCSSTLERLRHR